MKVCTDITAPLHFGTLSYCWSIDLLTTWNQQHWSGYNVAFQMLSTKTASMSSKVVKDYTIRTHQSADWKLIYLTLIDLFLAEKRCIHCISISAFLLKRPSTCFLNFLEHCQIDWSIASFFLFIDQFQPDFQWWKFIMEPKISFFLKNSIVNLL